MSIDNIHSRPKETTELLSSSLMTEAPFVSQPLIQSPQQKQRRTFFIAAIVLACVALMTLAIFLPLTLVPSPASGRSPNSNQAPLISQATGTASITSNIATPPLSSTPTATAQASITPTSTTLSMTGGQTGQQQQTPTPTQQPATVHYSFEDGDQQYWFGSYTSVSPCQQMSKQGSWSLCSKLNYSSMKPSIYFTGKNNEPISPGMAGKTIGLYIYVDGSYGVSVTTNWSYYDGTYHDQAAIALSGGQWNYITCTFPSNAVSIYKIGIDLSTEPGTNSNVPIYIDAVSW